MQIDDDMAFSDGLVSFENLIEEKQNGLIAMT